MRSMGNSPLHLSVKVSRGKTLDIDGTLAGVYPNVFTVKVGGENGTRMMSFNYCDIVSGRIMVSC
jgi:uncharacterized protein Veg